MVVGTDARVLLPWLRSRRGQSAWAPTGPFLAARTRNQLRASCPQVLFWGHTGHMQGFPLILCCCPVPCQLSPRCGPAGSCPHSWEEEVGPGPQSTQEGSSPSCPEPSGRGLPGPPGLSGLLSPRAISWQRVPPSQDHQDPTPRSRNSFLLTGAPVSPGLSWEPSPPFTPCPLVSLSFLPLLKGLLKMTPSISCCHV